MYKVEHLTKEFRLKGINKKIIALNDINLVFPEKGLVFVTGKSGSGKSTFLNILGGLDKPTKGDVYYKQLRLNKLHNYNLSKYRNSDVGFIFQDFCLFENLTVYENVKMALELQDEENDARINDLLKELNISDLRNKKAYKLSGGQKQRVSIARALIKHPKVILADEPTGNLDPYSSKIILDYLARVSKKTLVIIISHNLNDAYKYGDRIITLNEGQVIDDVSASNSERRLLIENKTLYLNDIKDLSDNELDNIKDEIIGDKINEIRPINEIFSKNKEEKLKEQEINLKKKHIPFFNIIRLFKYLLAKQTIKTILFSIVSMLVTCLFSLCLMFISFDDTLPVKDIMTNSEDFTQNFVKTDNKNSSDLETSISNIIPFTDEEINEINKYSNYKIYNFFLNADANTYLKRGIFNQTPSSTIYQHYTYGLMPIKKEDLKKIFNIDSVEFLALSNEIKDYGIYITDYTADNILSKQKNEDYEALLGVYNGDNSKLNSGYINGIINTHYMEKYPDIFDHIDQVNYHVINSNDEDNITLLDKIRKYYGMAYTFNSNFLTEFNKVEWRNNISVRSVEISDSNNDFYFYTTGYAKFIYVEDNSNYPFESDNEIHLPSTILNTIFNKSYTVDKWNEYLGQIKNIALKYTNSRGKTNSLKVEVKCSNEVSNFISCSKVLMEKILDFNTFVYQYAFKDKDVASNFYDKYNESGVMLVNYEYATATKVSQLATSYSKLFLLLGALLFVIAFICIFYMSFDSVKRQKNKIGILKSMGLSFLDLIRIYFVNFLVEVFFCGLFYLAFIFPLKEAANYVLINSIFKTFKSLNNIDYEIFTITPKVFSIAGATILFNLVMGVIIPIIRIMFIEPIDIIKTSKS